MMSIVNAGFVLSEEQKAEYDRIQHWLNETFHPETDKINKDLIEARANLGKLSRNDWKLVSKMWNAQYNNNNNW
jgi:hypothetical protein